MDRGAWWTTVQGFAKSPTQFSSETAAAIHKRLIKVKNKAKMSMHYFMCTNPHLNLLPQETERHILLQGGCI